MGSYTTQEFLDTFGGLPEPGDPQWLGPDPDDIRDALDERPCAAPDQTEAPNA